MTASSDVAGEEGMTLIELVISISLLGIIVGPITVMIFLGFLSNDGASDKVADSVSAQLVSSYLIPDVQSAFQVAPNQSACSAGGTAYLHLSWKDPVTGAATDVVYFSGIGPQGRVELMRQTCGGAGTTSTVLVQDLGPTGMVTVWCPPTGAKCVGADGTTMVDPNTLSVQITAQNAHPLSNTYYQPFTFQLDAHPRAVTS